MLPGQPVTGMAHSALRLSHEPHLIQHLFEYPGRQLLVIRRLSPPRPLKTNPAEPGYYRHTLPQ